jgi:hypothetical protein
MVGTKFQAMSEGAVVILALASALLAGCDGSSSSPAAPVALTCDDTMKTAFQPDANTSVLLVKSFKQNDPLILSGTATAQTPTAANDLCMVKLNVGPGNPGPASAPSTSPGIGIEIWLPTKANWNNRVHVVGGGGWQGGVQGSLTDISGAGPVGVGVVLAPSAIAGGEGAVSATTDTGHPNAVNGGSFAMNPDGTINTTLWTDFSSRGIHEMAVKSKALATAYYGTAPKYMYWDGFSTGGRQGMSEAQVNPTDFDGILAGAPAFNWSRFITGELYPQIVFQRDLAGTPLTTGQQDLASNAAISACDVVGGQHLGYILDPSTCHYDPTLDVSVLCASSGGTNSTANCVTATQATALNKIWYGMTADGSVPSPASDNGWSAAASPSLPSGVQRWFGQPRGASLYLASLVPVPGGIGLTSPNGPFSISSDQVALELQDPTIAGPTFINATGNGANGWMGLSYAQMSNAFDRGVTLQPVFGNINTDNPDLSAFNAHSGKLLHYHGLSDELIMPQASINYYNRVTSQMGGLASVQSFYRLFLVPGFGHSTLNGTANPIANNPAPAPSQLYTVLTAWVEQGTVPDSIVLNSPTTTPVAKSQPICAFPKKATYTSGDPNVAASYTCS